MNLFKRQTPFFDFKNQRQDSIFKLLFILFLSILLGLLPLMSLQSGLNGDEKMNYDHAELVYNYYAKGDTACLSTESQTERRTWLEYYGQSFDNFTYLFNKTFGIENDPYQSRHILNSICGWFIFLILGLFAVKLLGWRCGFITLVLLFLYPRFTGHVFNNAKDIPFALGYVWAIYQMYLLTAELPKIKIKRLILIALAIAFANSVRIGGLMLIPYLFMFAGLWFLFNEPIKRFFTADYWIKAFKLIGILSGVAVAAYFLGLLWWPYALQNPLKVPIEALNIMTGYSISIRQIFGGKNIWSTAAPLSYFPTYIWFSMPLLCLGGLIAFGVFTKKIFKELKFLNWFLIVFAFVFPIAYIMYQKSNVYGGLRHILFTLPFLVLMAGVGVEFLFRQFKNKKIQLGIWLAFILLALLPLKHIIKNHPFTYVYFNEFAGGIAGIYGDYETDYYYHGNKMAFIEFMKYIEEHPNPEGKTVIATDRQGDLRYYFNLFRTDTSKYELHWSRFYERFDKNWDYFITFYAYTDAYQLKHGLWPPTGTVKTLDIDGKPVVALIKRQDKSTFEAKKLQSQLSDSTLYPVHQALILESMKTLYEQALKADPYDEGALSGLVFVYRVQNLQDSALAKMKFLTEIHPSSEPLQFEYINMNYNLLQQTGDEFYLNEIKKTARKILDYNPTSIDAYNLLYQLYLQQKNVPAAKKIMLEAIEAVPEYLQGYYNLAELYMQSRQRTKAIEILEKCVKKNQKKYPEHVEQIKNEIRNLKTSSR